MNTSRKRERERVHYICSGEAWRSSRVRDERMESRPSFHAEKEAGNVNLCSQIQVTEREIERGCNKVWALLFHWWSSEAMCFCWLYRDRVLSIAHLSPPEGSLSTWGRQKAAINTQSNANLLNLTQLNSTHCCLAWISFRFSRPSFISHPYIHDNY